MDSDVFFSEGKYYVITTSTDMNGIIKLSEIDMTSGAIKPGKELKNFITDPRMMVAGEDGIYSSTSTGIFRLNISTCEMEEVLNWNQTDLDRSILDMIRCYPKNSDEIIAISQGNAATIQYQKIHVVHLHRAPENPHAGKKILNIGGFFIPRKLYDMDSVEIGALGKCIEKDGRYWFFGRHRAPEELKKYGKGDVYILVIDENGNEVNQRFIGGSRSDRLDNVEKTADGFILEVTSQSDDGDFAGSDAGYHEVNWRVVINDDLEIVEKEIVPDRFGIRIKVGEKDGEPLYSRDEMFSDFDAGFVEAYIDYGDTYLIVSNHQTGEYEHTPAYISSIWYYWETVYSMYDKSGTLVFRASVDSSPDYSKYEAC